MKFPKTKYLILLGVAVIAVVGGVYLSKKIAVEKQESEAAASGIWISPAEVQALPMSGSAWSGLKIAADSNCSTPDLANQDDAANVCVMAKALVFARLGQESYRASVVSALTSIVNSGTYNGRALALGRELIAYVIAADLIDLKNHNPSLDTQFRNKLRELLTTSTSGGPSSLIDCHENRPNNWGTHCGGSRVAVYAYLGDTAGIARVAQVFKGWLGDRSSYAGFSYGDLSWQCNSSAPVGVNPKGCTKSGQNIDGVLPDDQRRCGSFAWPPCQTGYNWEALQGALAQAVILSRQGYDVRNWSDQALKRSATWLYNVSGDIPSSDDTWAPWVVNFLYGTTFAAQSPTTPGKNVGWTDWTHSGTISDPPPGGGTNTADLNSDGKVDVVDLGILLGNWNATNKPKSDINQNGAVDVVDLGILLSKWGTAG